MAWFKKDQSTAKINCCEKIASDAITHRASDASNYSIKVLGSGCAKCNQLEDSVKQALALLDCEIDIEHVTDFVQIANYGVMQTPALVINNRVVSYGKVLKPQEVLELLRKSNVQ